MSENNEMSPATALALLEIAKDLTLAAAGKTNVSLPGMEYHAKTGTDLALLFKTCVCRVEEQYRLLLCNRQDIDEPL